MLHFFEQQQLSSLKMYSSKKTSGKRHVQILTIFLLLFGINVVVTTTLQIQLTDYNESSVNAPPSTFRRSNVTMGQANYSYEVILKSQNLNHSLARLLVGVSSVNSNFAKRQAIRRTWGASAWRRYFMVAGNFSTVENEFYLHKDLLWVDIDEDYKSALTPKTMAFLHFANSMKIDHAFKTDDDMYVNITHLNSQLSPDIDYFGLALRGSPPIRDLLSKYYLSEEEYPAETFPDYASGGGYAVSSRFLACACEKMRSLPHMCWEDVAVGLLAAACGINITAADWLPDAFWNSSGYFRSRPSNIPIAHNVTIGGQFLIHNGLQVIENA